MKKMFLLLSLGVLCASLALAQDNSTTSPSATPSADTSTSASSVQGCLSGSTGNYMLTQDGTGTTYKLMGNEDQLKKHVGHEVAISGQAASGAGSSASAADQGQPSSASSDGTVLQVTEVKMISRHCSSGASSPQSH